jgi:SAM-dependent methyltransferase
MSEKLIAQSVSAAREVYQSSDTGVRASFGSDSTRALDYYQPIVAFIKAVHPPQEGAARTTLLDVGCGVGWSTYALATAGYDATGIDLNPAAFEAPVAGLCRVLQGDAMSIAYPPDSFDIVACYQCLEHVPDPEKALAEMVRIVRPGGTVAIVGPNLVTPLPGLAFLCKPSSWRTLSFRRYECMPTHPSGNTLPEILGFAFLRSLQLCTKLLRHSPRFTMRSPDTVPPFHADNDACYLCNPIDLIRYFEQVGFIITVAGKPGRPTFANVLAGGTWVAARKPLE